MHSILIKSTKDKFFKDAVRLFNEYRKFYEQASDLEAAENFLSQRIENNQSDIFLAIIDDKAVGFMQLYYTFSSIGLREILILNDLFIDENFRGKSIGRFLLHEVKNFAKNHNLTKIILSTAVENITAQKLYESEGYERNEGYYDYGLEVE